MIYQTFVPFDNSTAANILKWAQSFGQALFNFGWTAQTGHGEVVASAVSTVWTWTNSPAIPTSTTGTPRSNVINFRGAWSSGSGYVANDTVTKRRVNLDRAHYRCKWWGRAVQRSIVATLQL